MCLTTFKNIINFFFNKSMKRGNAKANAMNNNLNNYIKHTYSSKK